MPSGAYGDKVVRWLNKRHRFNIEHLLWDFPGHRPGHAHLDFAPNFDGRPPCA
jgi:hypothetical protein